MQNWQMQVPRRATCPVRLEQEWQGWEREAIDRVQITEEVKEPRNFPQEDLHLENIFLTVVYGK